MEEKPLHRLSLRLIMSSCCPEVCWDILDKKVVKALEWGSRWFCCIHVADGG